MENRRHPRMESAKYRVDISDGQKFFSGYVNNLSRFGLCLEDLPKKIDHTARRLSVVITSDGKTFKMLTRYCWTIEEHFSKMIGLEIINAPWDWTEFVMAKEPLYDAPWAEAEI